ncbi:hypothetical protein ACFW1A_22755 [Kitasatospora sp. NPDC058965]|uniref:hypothetical protein n=1 Tax=Kitasatospora sp. NPDC058965 TaxID=3346682 RepID=UPI0036AA18E1
MAVTAWAALASVAGVLIVTVAMVRIVTVALRGTAPRERAALLKAVAELVRAVGRRS